MKHLIKPFENVSCKRYAKTWAICSYELLCLMSNECRTSLSSCTKYPGQNSYYTLVTWSRQEKKTQFDRLLQVFSQFYLIFRATWIQKSHIPTFCLSLEPNKNPNIGLNDRITETGRTFLYLVLLWLEVLFWNHMPLGGWVSDASHQSHRVMYFFFSRAMLQERVTLHWQTQSIRNLRGSCNALKRHNFQFDITHTVTAGRLFLQILNAVKSDKLRIRSQKVLVT